VPEFKSLILNDLVVSLFDLRQKKLTIFVTFNKYCG
jgi:hypothetical protein